MKLTFPSIFPVTCHTKFVGPGSIFVALQGQKEHGITYIPQALAQGATCIVVQDDVELSVEYQTLIVEKKASLLRVDNARKALALLSAQALGYPANKLNIIGITGTKGKTTSSFLLEHCLRTLGYKTALLSSVYNKILNEQFKTELTTQHPDYLHVFFDLCVQAEVDYVVMEVAAQAISLHRTEGILFDAVLFTNFSHEHGEFYQTMDDYLAAKVMLADQRKAQAPLIFNGDDAHFTVFTQDSFACSFGRGDNVTMQLKTIQSDATQTIMLIRDNKQHQTMIATRLIGLFNAYNCLGVFSTLLLLGLSADSIAQALQSFEYVPGRFEQYRLPNGAQCIIDYASNPASFEIVLSTLQTFTSHLIVVFGAGGDRDKLKRPIMGSLATQYAQTIIITTDNPRSEDPADIAQQILVGISQTYNNNVIVELDREKAIKIAYSLSKSSTIIALLGKGPDEYQIIKGTKVPFSEREVVKNL